MIPVANCRCRPSDDLTSYSLISCQVSPRCEKCVGHRDLVAPHWPTTTTGQKTFGFPGLTHVKVLPKELCYLNFRLDILNWIEYNKADTPVDKLLGCICSVMTHVRQCLICVAIFYPFIYDNADAEIRGKVGQYWRATHMLPFQKSKREVTLTKCDEHNVTFLWYSLFLIDKTLIWPAMEKINCALCPLARRVMAILRCH